MPTYKAKDKHFFGFNGMNNMLDMAEYQLDEKRRIVPRIVLNADVYDDGKVKPRTGQQKIISLSQCHSLWRGSAITLCVATGANGSPALYRIDGGNATEICEVEGPLDAPMHFAQLENRIYLSNGYWRKIYDNNGAVAWGLPLPPKPVAIPCEGYLPPGRYSFCYTYQDGDRLSGNGPILSVEWEGGESGIKLINLPDNALFWLTQPNGDTLYLATPVAGEVTTPYYAQPLPSLDVGEVPNLKCLSGAHGRIFGVQANTLHYSQPFRYEWFKDSNHEPFPDELVMVAPYEHGLYVHSISNSWVLEGTDPSQWTIQHIGNGAVPGTLIYAMLEGGGYEIRRTLSEMPSPAWMSATGVVIGTNTGKLVHLTKNRLKINSKTQGSSMFRTLAGGEPQIVMSLWGSYGLPPDPALQEIFTTGKLN